MKYLITLFFFVTTIFVDAQSLQTITGKWNYKYQPWPNIPAIDVEMTVFAPVNEMLFPAKLKISYASFKSEYDFLLVKKDENKLGIARNKFPIKEEPYSLGPWLMYLNGHFELQENKGKTQLNLERLWIKDFGIFMKGVDDDEMQTHSKVYVRDFLYNAKISLKQTEKFTKTHPKEDEIINPKEIYYGVYDAIEVDDSEIQLSIQDEERYDKDSITIVHNGKIVANKIMVKEAVLLNKIKLIPGDNFIAFFAENYGDLPPNTANFLTFVNGAKEPQYSFDFTHKSNAYATLMVAHFIYNPPKNLKINDKKPIPDYNEGRINQSVGSLKTNSETVNLDFWDTRQQDGDIISVYINDEIFVKKLEVKHKHKTIKATLKPGKNKIIFKAENLGKIPPNTAALKIHGDGFEKTIQLSTDFQRNNVLEIEWVK